MEKKKKKRNVLLRAERIIKSNQNEMSGKGFGETVGDVTRLRNGRQGGKQINGRVIRARRLRYDRFAGDRDEKS